MMSKKEKNIYGLIRLFLVVLFAIGVVVIAVYPFDNRNLELRITTDSGEYIQECANVDILNGNCNEIVIEDIDQAKIKKVRIYGALKSMLIKEISFGDFWGYISSADEGEMQWTDTGIDVTGDGQIHLLMNGGYVEMLTEVSASFLQERLILLGLWAAVVVILQIISSAIKEMREEENWNNHTPLFEAKKFLKDIKKYGQYMVYAANTDLKAEVANSYLNRLWWLLEPFFNMLVYVIVFGNMMGNSVKNYATFVFSALLMWNYFNKTVNYSVKLVRNNKDIITKVYIPKFVLLMSNMILNMFKLLFSLMVLVVMMFIFKVQIGFNILWVIPAYIMMILLAFGVGMIFMHFGVYVDDLSYAVGILLNMVMFLSGIFYDVMTTLPEPLNILLMCLNPVAVFVDTMRNALLYNTASNIPLLGMWLVISVLLCCIGVHVVYKNENSYVKVV